MTSRSIQMAPPLNLILNPKPLNPKPDVPLEVSNLSLDFNVNLLWPGGGFRAQCLEHVRFKHEKPKTQKKKPKPQKAHRGWIGRKVRSITLPKKIQKTLNSMLHVQSQVQFRIIGNLVEEFSGRRGRYQCVFPRTLRPLNPGSCWGN